MNIFFVYASPFPRKSGHTAADRRVRDLIRGLIYSGIGAKLVTPISHRSMIDRNHSESFDILYLGKNIYRNFFLLERISFWIEFIRKSLHNNVDGVLFYNTKIDSIIPAIILKILGKKIFWELCDYHSDFSKKITFRGIFERINEFIFSKISNQIFVISHFLENHVKYLNKKASTTIIPITVDTDVFITDFHSYDIRKKYGISDETIIVSYVGGMWRHQGVKNLILAFKELIKETKNAKLVIAGNYVVSDLHDDVCAMVKQLQLSESVILPGWLGTQDVQKILAESDILVLSQLSGQFTTAGLPTKLAEYCATGKPIVATNVGDISKYLTHRINIYLCEPDSPSEIKNSLLELIENKSLRLELGINAKQLSTKKFCYKEVGKKIADQLLK